MLNARARAATIIAHVLNKEVTLGDALASAFAANENNAIASKDHSFIQELCYGTLRFYPQLDFLAKQLLLKPLPPKSTDLYALLLIGLYQLLYLATPVYAALSATVEAAKQLKKAWAANLVNAVLRNFQRQRQCLLQKAAKDCVAQTAHPHWLLKKIQAAYPHDWQTICFANNQQAPMVLRVNQQKMTREHYLQKLIAHNIASRATLLSNAGLYLQHAVSVQSLPGFVEGELSVQDEAAQLAAILLDLHAGQRVLDACAAPGGKTTHILEVQPTIELIALEISPKRAAKIYENLQRLGLQAKVLIADAQQPGNWWDKKLFDRMLVDAPCSATGIIRRHPDIKIVKQAKHINELVKVQQRLLEALWPLLKVDGILLYATCSILPEENQHQIECFLRSHADALLLHEQQLLPQLNGHDGFYYAGVKKLNNLNAAL